MGIGMVIICTPIDAIAVQAALQEETWIIGSVVAAHPGLVELR